MSAYLRLNLPLFLPQMDHHDPCLQRLLEQLDGIKGVEHAHVVRDKPHKGETLLCLHYDPNLLALRRLERLARQTGTAFTDRYRHEDILISNQPSADASLFLEERLKGLSGMLHANVNPAAGIASVAYDSAQLSRKIIGEKIGEMGFTYPTQEQAPSLLGRKGATAKGVQARIKAGMQERIKTGVQAESKTGVRARLREKTGLRERIGLYGQILGKNSQLLASLLSGFLLLAGWLGESLMGMGEVIVIPLYAAAIILAGYDTSRHAWRALIKLKFDTDLLMIMAAVGAISIARWEEAAFLLFLFSLGHAGEHYALDRARNAIKSLGTLLPSKALLRVGEGSRAQFIEKDINQIQVKDLVLVRPGDRIPVDGRIEKGQSMINQSAITGESLPLLKRPGDQVFSGTINEDNALEIRTERATQDNTINRIIQLVAEAQSQKSPTQEFTRRFMSWFVPTVLLSSLAVMLFPPLVGWMQWSESLYRGILLIIAASPCALALSTPAAVLAGIGQAARNGVLIKGGVHLENLSRIEAIAFDKTGTLTEGQLSLTDIIPQDGISSDELLITVATLEQSSSHPLAEAIVASAKKRGLQLGHCNDLKNIPGHGVSGYVNGKEITAGARHLLSERGQKIDIQFEEIMRHLESRGRNAMLVARERRIIGILGFTDQVRSEAAATIEQLRRLKVRYLCILTGDTSQMARRIGDKVGLADIHANLLPEEKLRRIQELERHYGAICMVGDGVNDAPALATATVGIAMGGAGTAMALETADVALMGDKLDNLPYLIELSRKSRNVIRQNLWISLTTIVFLLAASFSGILHLSSAVVLHEGSTIAVVLNALRLLGYKKAGKKDVRKV